MHNKLKLTLAVTATTLAGLQVNGQADTTASTSNPQQTPTITEDANSQTASENLADKQADLQSAQTVEAQAQSAVDASANPTSVSASQTSASANSTSTSATTQASTSATIQNSQNSLASSENTVANTTTSSSDSQATSSSTIATTDTSEAAASQTTTEVQNKTTAKAQTATTKSVKATTTKAVAPADADGQITQLIGDESELPTTLTEPKDLANGTESRSGDYYGWYDVDQTRDTSAKLTVQNNRLIASQQKELAEYALELINSFRASQNLAPLVMTDKIWQAVSDRELAYRTTHQATVDQHTTFVELGSNNQSYNPTNLFIESSSQNLGFGSATTMLEAKIDILNALTAMAYKDADSNNGHRQTMLTPFKSDQVAMLVPFVDYVGNRGGAFTWDYLTDVIVFDKRDLNTFASVSDQRVAQELGLATASDTTTPNSGTTTPSNQTKPSTGNSTASSQVTGSTATKQGNQTTQSTGTTAPSNAAKLTQTQKAAVPTSATKQMTTQANQTPQLEQLASPDTANTSLGDSAATTSAGVQLQRAKENTAKAQANLVLAQAQADAAQRLKQNVTAPKTKSAATASEKAPANATKQANETLPNTGSNSEPASVWAGIGLLLSTLGFGISRKKRH
ncbi:LPXTG-motif cell wall-anchored protein [Weissella uvarum]|uniref:LPXTG cell wall anchor domain-containing protein n=1 Tax=Weissella uvarum TaxID=1479233 RepID=UPI00195F5B27|nr:LPXTG cell wall anchor domain-containing protein [Weissella uvarum]MBM7617615.1 LPXTG-motif cell wall-anchored protein [Weissella uvarum]MCM0595965.1 LPXTG cell wall anchor domain-containing protein [Weissella uvarum]